MIGALRVVYNVSGAELCIVFLSMQENLLKVLFSNGVHSKL